MTNTKELVPVEGVNTDDMQSANELQVWTGYETGLAKLQTSAEMVLAADPLLPTTSKLAKATRLDFKRLRVDVEHTRKERTEYHLRQKQQIDGQAKRLKDAMEHFEDKLLALEQHAERAEAERLRILTQERTEALVAVNGPVAGLNLGALTEEQWADMLNGAALVFEQKAVQTKAEEEARIAREKADAEERERIRLENIRLKEEAEQKERELAAERERVAKEAAEAAEKARKEREAIELRAKQEAEAAAAKAKTEKEAIEAKARQEKRLADEKAAKIKAEADRKQAELEATAKAEREKAAAEARKVAQEALTQQEKANREAAEYKKAVEDQATKLAEEKRKAEIALATAKKAEADRLAAIEAEKQQQAAAPDKEKIQVFAERVRALLIPGLKTPKGIALGAEIQQKCQNFAVWIEKQMKEAL